MQDPADTIETVTPKKGPITTKALDERLKLLESKTTSDLVPFKALVADVELMKKVATLEQDLANLKAYSIHLGCYKGFANYLKQYGYKAYQPTRKDMHKFA